MSKIKSKGRDPRRFRLVTWIVAAAAAVICIILSSVLIKYLHLRFFIGAGAGLLLYAVLAAAAFFVLSRKSGGSRVISELEPSVGRITFDAVAELKSPAFICDSHEKLVWYNDAMSRFIDPSSIGIKLREVIGITLGELKSGTNGGRLSLGNRTFSTSFNHVKTENNDFTLVVTYDTTEKDALIDEMSENESVVCYIVIDNYIEMMQFDSELYRPVSAQIDSLLRDWAEKNEGILKEYEGEKYFFVTNMRTLNRLIAGRFGILDEVRALTGESSLPLTISMGVSGIKGTFEEKDKAAHSALDMALQRGGDQAAVKSEISMDFYGGMTKTVQKRTNVKSRVVGGKLSSLMKSSSNVIIMGHKHADFDSVGSCVGLARMAMYCGVRVNIVIDTSDPALYGCRQMVESEEDFRGVFVDADRGLDLLGTSTLVIASDFNNIDMAEEPAIARNAQKFAVIDHHIKKSEFEREPLIEYIEPSASAACELVAEMLEQVLPKDSLTAAEANLMLAGITLDTKQFTKNTGTRTFSVAMYLRDRGADPASVLALFKESFDDYRREAMFRGNVEIYKDAFAITVADDDKERDVTYRVIAAKAADNLLMVDGVEASFSVVRIGDRMHISARSTGNVNVQLIMESMGGGGHFDGAAVQLDGISTEEAVKLLKNAIDGYTTKTGGNNG